ncbi:MAG: hypothetical protein GYB68_01285, partial [Chloroflexi bacterium]|nr:hypothetical protein [Chloroflexota bacterium]
LATGVGSSTVSSEIEAQTFASLRLTPIPERHIVLAKWSATVRQMRPALLFILITRHLLLVGLVLVMGVGVVEAIVATSPAGLASAPSPGQPQPLPEPPPEFTPQDSTSFGEFWEEAFPGLPISSALSILLGTFGLIGAALAFYLLQPWVQIMMFSALGVLASSLARTRSGGLVTAIILRVGLWILTYVISQMIQGVISILVSLILVVPAATLGSSDLDVVLNALSGVDPGLFGLFYTGSIFLSLLLVIVLQIGTLLACLALAAGRAKRIPYR